MNERLITYNFQIFDPDHSGGAIGASALLTMVPFGATLVYASVSPHEDDSGATIDIQDDATDIVTGIDASDHDVPGEWISTHCGGSQTPVAIAAGSELEIDVNSAAATTRLDVTLLFLQGETWG
jgi:hypothetical protein